MESIRRAIRAKPARQQPDWADPGRLRIVTERLSASRPLVRAKDVRLLKARLAQVARGEAHVVQCGDCAEDPDEHTVGDVARKTAVLDLLAGTMRLATHKPVLRVGRLAGQYAKPRSADVERFDGRELAVYRGHLVNRPEPTPDHRRADPANILRCYHAAREVMRNLGWLGGSRYASMIADARVWTSHEALLLDYELPMLRPDGQGGVLLGSTHWPWLGERTRQYDGAHTALLATISNPVACKIGPAIERDDLLALCDRLDPRREPGRLTLISRMGADAVRRRLPELAEAVRAAGHPVIWLTDPMHGNTVSTHTGLKTRYVNMILREVREFQAAIQAAGAVTGGLHLETTPDDVTECVDDASTVDQVAHKYTTLCDPRLNVRQAVAVAAAWQG